MNSGNTTKPSPTPDFSGLIEHYWRLFWRNKWYIVPVMLTVSVATYIIATKVMPLQPKQTTSVLIGVEDPSRGSGVDGFASDGDTKVEMLRSRKFLGPIVEALGLRLHLTGYDRAGIFDSCTVGAAAVTGKYKLVVNESDSSTYEVMFSNRVERIDNRVVTSGSIAALNALVLPGITPHFSEAFLRSPRTVHFSVLPLDDAISVLIKTMTIVPPDPYRNRTHIKLSIEGRDYRQIARIANAIADSFIKQNIDMRNGRIDQTESLLNKQLATASEQLAVSENALRAFLSANPRLGLRLDAQQAVGQLRESQSGARAVDQALVEARSLKARCDVEDDSVKFQAVREALVFLSTRNSTRAQVLNSDFNDGLTLWRTQKRSYAPNHPVVQETRRRLLDISFQVVSALGDYIFTSQDDLARRRNSADRISDQLNSLPSLERRLAALQGKQEIDSRLYTGILSRQREVEVAKSAELAGVFIIDYAVPPRRPLEIIILLQILAASLLAGLAAAIIPILILDKLDPTARTEWDLQHRTSFKVLGSIPAFASGKNKHNGKRSDSLAHQRVVTAGDTSPFVNEAFESLRTRLLLELQKNGNCRTVVVTSLNPGDGKSLVAANLAAAMAQLGFPILLIDADLRRGVQHKTFALKPLPGLSEVLSAEQGSAGQTQTTRESLQSTGVDRLTLMACGSRNDHPIKLLSSDAFTQFALSLGKVYSMIVIDTPPLGIVTDAVVLHALAARYLVVARSGSTNIRELQRKVTEFSPVSDSLLGMVLNRAEANGHRKRQYASYYLKIK